MPRPRGQRREHILQAIATMLEQQPGEPITTAALAAKVGVSEAALYRHFPSKGKMFEGLIEFMEESLLSRMHKIASEEADLERRVQAMALLMLGFAEKNPGLATLLHGAGLVGETERLRTRVSQLHERLELALRQSLREPGPAVAGVTPGERARLVMAVVEGRVAQFVRTRFAQTPLSNWDAAWQLLRPGLFPSVG